MFNYSHKKCSLSIFSVHGICFGHRLSVAGGPGAWLSSSTGNIPLHKLRQVRVNGDFPAALADLIHHEIC